MQALGGLIAGNPVKAYQETRGRKQQLDTGDADALGDAAYGRSLPLLFNAPMPGATPISPPPGQPSQPMMQPSMGPPPGGGMPGQPQPPMGLPGGGPPMQGGPPPGAPGPSLGPQPPSPMGPGAAGGPPSGGFTPPGPGGQGGPLDWRTAVQAVVRANPGIEQNPRALARAVDHYLPLMNQMSQQQWREMTLAVRQSGIESREAIARTYEAGRDRRLERSEEGRTERTEITEGGRSTRAETAEAGREGRSQRAESGRQQRFESREKRLDRNALIRQDQGAERLRLQREDLERKITQGGDRTQLAQWRTLLDAEHKRAQEIISAYSLNSNLPDEERKKLLAEQDKFYRDQIEMMKNAGSGKQPGGSKTPDRVPQVATPEEASKLAPGTRYRTPDGQEYVR